MRNVRLDEAQAGIKIARRSINNLRYADDTTLMAEETGLTLRGAGKAGNPFHTKHGNRISCRDQEGRWGSDEVGPGAMIFVF